MPTLNDTDPRIVYALFKGEPGLRKSTNALSFPGRQFWFSWDRKMNGLLIPMKNWNVDPKLIEYEDYDDWAKPQAQLNKFVTKCEFDNLIFDSVTSCGDMTLRQTRRAKQTGGKTIGGIRVDDIEDFNAESSALNELIAMTKDIQSYNYRMGRIVNIILIAHVMEVSKVSLDNKVHVTRTIVTAGKRVAAKIPAYCNEVYHFGMQKGMTEGSGGKYVILTQGTGDDFARTSLPIANSFEIGDKQLYKDFMLPAINQLLTAQNKPTYNPYNKGQ